MYHIALLIFIFIHMNEFDAQHIGLVLGLAKIQKKTCTKGHAAMEGIFGVERLIQILKDTDLHIEALGKIITEYKIEDVAHTSSDNTFHHLLVICDLFIGEKWADVESVGEWSGFFEGLAMTRWAVVRGISETLMSIEQSIIHNDLFLLVNQASEFHYAMLHDGLKFFHKTGTKKAIDVKE